MKKILIILLALHFSFSQAQTTIINHGWCDPDLIDALYGWMLTQANAIKNRVGGKIMIYNQTTGNFDYYSGSGNHAILLFDWRVESTLNVTGYSEADGNALFAALLKGKMQGNFNLNDLHFIAHSRGTVVDGEAVERLLVMGIPVDHVTNIDAHDWGLVNQLCTDFDANPSLNQMGVINWIGVNFSDSYWQDNPVPLTGRKVDGTYSKYLGGVLDGFNHVMIPDWYTGTVTDYGSSEGFRYSKIAGGTGIRPAPNYGTAILPLLDYDYDGIVNGNFERGQDNFIYIPGWSYHGGVGTAFMENGHLKLNSGGYNRISNRFYIPYNASFITFDYRVNSASSGTPPATDKMQVKFGNTVVMDNVYLNNSTTGYQHMMIDVRNYRNSVQTIEFVTVDPAGGHSSISSETWIDNVKFEIGINLGPDTALCIGDTLVLDAGNMGKMTGVTYLWSTGSSSRSITVTSPGTYSVMANKNGRIARDTIVVRYFSRPAVELGNDVTMCDDEYLILDAGNPGCYYLWNTFDETRYLPVQTSGLYSVVVTNHACPDASDSIIVNIIPKPRFDLGADTVVCYPVNTGVNNSVVNAISVLFNGSSSTVTPGTNLAISNNFTVEFWVKPDSIHEIDMQSNIGTGGITGQRYIIFPAQGDVIWGSGHAGMGVSAGINGVTVYEHANAYLAPVLVWEGIVSGWTHVAVVYNNRQPYLYINGKLVKRGLKSTKSYIHPSAVLGGGNYGYFKGQADEFRIWNHIRWQTMIYENMLQKMSGAEPGLMLYWPMDDNSSSYFYDLSTQSNNGRNNNAEISGQVPFHSAFDNCIFNWSTGAHTPVILSSEKTSLEYRLTVINPDGCSSSDTIYIGYNDTLCENFSVEDMNEGMSVWPNPCSSAIVIKIQTAKSDFEISLVNILGDVVMKRQVTLENGLIRFDVSGLNPGIYSLVVRSAEIFLHSPLIIQ